MLRPPNKRPKLMAKLKDVYDAYAQGKHGRAAMLLARLPDETQAVIALVQYLGRFGDLYVRSHYRKLHRARNIYVGRTFKLAEFSDDEHAAIFGCAKPDVPPDILESRPYARVQSIDYETGDIEFVMTDESEAPVSITEALYNYTPPTEWPPPEYAAPAPTIDPVHRNEPHSAVRIVNASAALSLSVSALYPDDRPKEPHEETSVDWADAPFTWPLTEGEP